MPSNLKMKGTTRKEKINPPVGPKRAAGPPVNPEKIGNPARPSKIYTKIDAKAQPNGKSPAVRKMARICSVNGMGAGTTKNEHADIIAANMPDNAIFLSVFDFSI